MSLSALRAPIPRNSLRTVGDVLECPKGSHAPNLGSKRFAHTALRGGVNLPPLRTIGDVLECPKALFRVTPTLP